jgi:hypothetical protein
MELRIKQLWTSALRSGEFEQTSQALRVNNSFCCLGVLTELYHRETGLGSWFENGKLEDGITPFLIDSAQVEYTELPTCVMVWAGMDSINPTITVNGKPTELTLAGLNDSGVKFDKIAEVIDKCL